ncbi:tripartite motif-containing protein 3-like [Lytechinus variegatus]|uniref:tripartite motif-containing protein 3-like n=1 Tax=Lytechinus variegatus TaxID=7654 RepID=UPI001BB1DCA8|nr:tripartite motif-containing protein 3-like [Lytechinus variegatus]
MAGETKGERKLKRLEEAMRCPQCQKQFQDPRYLSCGHSFCRKCISELVVLKTVSCSLCEKPSHVPHGDTGNLMKNLTLAGLIDSYKNPYTEPSIKCSGCKVYESREAVDHCYTCHKSICSLCSQSHFNFRHKVVPIADYEMESMEARDKMTESLIGRIAIKKNALEQRKGLVSTQMKRVESSACNLIEDIRKTFNEHFKRLQEVRDALLEETRDREEFLLNKLHTVEDYVQTYQESLSKISANLMMNNNKILRGGALTNHITLCQELEGLLQDDIDVGILKETSAYSESFSFHANEPSSMGTTERAHPGEWKLGYDMVAPNIGSVRSLCATPDGKLAVGYAKNKGGMSLFNPYGRWEHIVSLDGIMVRSVAFLTDGRCVILDTDNNLSMYSISMEKQSFEFETLDNSKGGTGQLCVDEQHSIFVAYKAAKKIQIFSPNGGAARKEITFGGIDPLDIRVSPGGALFLVSWRKLFMLNLKGEITGQLMNNSSDELMVADVCRDNTLLVGYVSQRTECDGVDRLTIRRYDGTTAFNLKETLVNEHPIAISKVPFYSIRELTTGEICFSTKDRVYFFKAAIDKINDVGFDDYDICSTRP